MNWDKLLSRCKDYHVPAYLGVFGIGTILQWFGHLDLSFVAFTGTVLGALTGHAFSPAAKDKASDSSDSPDSDPNDQAEQPDQSAEHDGEIHSST
jgi:hypothetical protein